MSDLSIPQAEQEKGVLEHVLLVDDNPVNLKILYKTLSNGGYKLLTAEDGETAVQIAQQTKPSLILLDIMMPGIDGYEVCEILKNNPDTADIAIIFLSALEISSAKVKAFAVGGVDYISKPFQADEVVARVRNHIKIHRLERQLARRNFELESENHQIFNAVSEGIIGLDKDGRITMLNPSAMVICGWAVADCLGEQLTALRLFEVDETVKMQEHETLPYLSYRMGQSAHSDMKLIRRRDNTFLPIAITSTPRAEGGAVVVFRDISEWLDSEEALRIARQELESQRQNIAHMERLNTTGAMAAGIAHEVNQPLTAISNYSGVARRLLERENFQHQQLAELLDKLNVQSERASEVIHRMRSYVKKPNGVLSEVDVNEMVMEVIVLAEVDSRINDVSVHFEPQLDLPALHLDVVQIQQVTLNLIRNAMEATAMANSSAQGVMVKTERQGNAVFIRVIDHGVGIAEGKEDQVFNPFYTTKTNGMGIGLSICQSIIQAQGGTIGFEHNPKGGASFYFSLAIT